MGPSEGSRTPRSGSGPAVRVERRGAALWAIIDRPAASNSIDTGALAGLEAAVAEAAGDTAVRAFVLTGANGVFCAGADIAQHGERIAAGEFDDVAEVLARASRLTDRIAELPIPTIAAVDGAAFAGGFELVLACDFVVATTRARFADGHVADGFVPGWGSTARAPIKLGPAIAARLLLVGDALSPNQLPMLVAAIVEPDELDGAVEAIVDRIATAGPNAIAAVKTLLAQRSRSTHAEAMAAEQAALRTHLRSAELAEGAAAFREHRRAAFGSRPAPS